MKRQQHLLYCSSATTHAPSSVDGRAVSIIPIIIHRYSTQIVGVLAAPNSPSDGYFFQCFCSPAYMHSRDQLKQPMFLSRKANNYLVLLSLSLSSLFPFPFSQSLWHSGSMGLTPLYSSIVIARYSRYLLHLLPYGARPFHDVLPAVLLWSTLVW